MSLIRRLWIGIVSPAQSTNITPASLDRKSTRLNSSHDQISYAVFCLKKKKKETTSSAQMNLESPNQGDPRFAKIAGLIMNVKSHEDHEDFGRDHATTESDVIDAAET